MALPDGESAPRLPSAPRRVWRRVPVYARIASVVAVASIIAFFVTGSSVNQSQALLLHSEATQSAAFIASEIDSASAVQDSLAAATGNLGGSTVPFREQAAASVHSPLSVALVENFLGRFTVLTEVGSGFRVGASLSPSVIAAYEHPGTAAGGSAVSPFQGGTFTTWVGPPVTPKGLAVYAQLDMAQILAHAVSAISVPGLSVSLYDSAVPQSSTLLAGRDLLVRGHGAVATARMASVDAQWAVAVSTSGPITGALGTITPVVVLLLGLSVALAVILVGVLLHQRRRVARGVVVSSAATHDESPPSLVPTPALGPVSTASLGAVAGGTAPPCAPNVAAEPAAAEAPDRPGDPGAQPRDSGIAVRGVLRPTPTVLPQLPDPAVGQPEAAAPLARHAEWRPDPYGRHELRRFFLGVPTSVVRSGSIESYDPVPDAHGGHRVADEQASRLAGRSADEPVALSTAVYAERDQRGDAGAASDPAAPVDAATEADAVTDVDEALEAARELDEIAARVARTIKEELVELHLAPLAGPKVLLNGAGDVVPEDEPPPSTVGDAHANGSAAPTGDTATPSANGTGESLVAFLRRTQSGRR